MAEFKWYGHFNSDDSYTVTEPETPRHWYNYMFNDEYVTFTSQVGFGEGLCQDDMGRRILLLSNRNIFLAEDGKHWSLFGLPLDYGYTDYACDHVNGFSTIRLSYNGIASAVRIFVPNEGRREIWSVTLTNNGDTERTLNLVSYAKTEVDGTYRPQAYSLGQGGFHEEKKAVFAKDYRPLWSKGNRKIYCYMTASEEITGFDARRNAFIGPYGDEQHPAALRKFGGCTNSDCNSEKLCLALQNTITLAPGETKTAYFQLGVEMDNFDAITSPTAASAEAEFEAMQDFIKRAKLFNCGFFAYSREPDTAAYRMKGQIHHATKKRRVKALYETQREISKEILSGLIGKEIEVLCDGIDYDKNCFVGRAYFNAPDIDGKIFFLSDRQLVIGDFVKVKINDTIEYDLLGELI